MENACFFSLFLPPSIITRSPIRSILAWLSKKTPHAQFGRRMLTASENRQWVDKRSGITLFGPPSFSSSSFFFSSRDAKSQVGVGIFPNPRTAMPLMLAVACDWASSMQLSPLPNPSTRNVLETRHLRPSTALPDRVGATVRGDRQ